MTRLIQRLSLFVFAISFSFIPAPGRAQAPAWSTLGGIDRATGLISTGRFAEAIPIAKAQLAEAEARVGNNHPDLIPFLQTLGTALFGRQDFDEAEIIYKRGLQISERSFGPNDQNVMSFAGTLAAIYMIQNRSREAAEMMARTGASR